MRRSKREEQKIDVSACMISLKEDKTVREKKFNTFKKNLF